MLASGSFTFELFFPPFSQGIDPAGMASLLPPVTLSVAFGSLVSGTHNACYENSLPPN